MMMECRSDLDFDSAVADSHKHKVNSADFPQQLCIFLLWSITFIWQLHPSATTAGGAGLMAVDGRWRFKVYMLCIDISGSDICKLWHFVVEELKTYQPGCTSNATKWIRFSWITLPLLSTAHKVVYTGSLSCRSGYFESIIHFYWILQRVRERLGQIKSSSITRALEAEQFFILHNPNTLMSRPTDSLLWLQYNGILYVRIRPDVTFYPNNESFYRRRQQVRRD